MSPITHRLLLAATVAGALALPATAAAHPGIFAVDAQVVAPGSPTPPTAADLITQRQFAIINDGRVIALRESNGLSGSGMVNYKKLPGTFRANTAEFPTKAGWLAYAPAQTDLQLHATCTGVAALSSSANILAWQEDPFFDYIPWQKDSAGLGDEPAEWIPVVKTATGVDLAALSTVQEFTTACTTLGGTYHPADTVVTTPANASSASIADALAPVQASLDGAQAELVDVKGQLTALTSAKNTVDGQVTTTASALTAAQSEAAAAKAEVARLRLELAPLAVKVAAPRSPKTFGSTGQPLTVTAAPGASVTVVATVTAGKAKTLGLKSTTLGTAKATAAATGSGSLTLTPSAKAKKALAKASGSLAVTFTATSGQRTQATTTTLAR